MRPVREHVRADARACCSEPINSVCPSGFALIAAPAPIMPPAPAPVLDGAPAAPRISLITGATARAVTSTLPPAAERARWSDRLDREGLRPSCRRVLQEERGEAGKDLSHIPLPRFDSLQHNSILGGRQPPVDVRREVGGGFRARPTAAASPRQCQVRPAPPASGAGAWWWRVGDDALGISQVVGNLDQPQGIEKAEGGRLAALDVEGHDLCRSPTSALFASAACG